MLSHPNNNGVGAALVVLILSGCSSPTKSPLQPAPETKTAQPIDGINEVHELWKASQQIAPLLPTDKPTAVGAERERILQSLKDRPFLQFEPYQRKSFRDFRDSIVKCSEGNDAKCSVTNLGKFFALLADWKIDSDSARQLDDKDYVDVIGRVETFAKSLSLINIGSDHKNLPDPPPCEFIFGQLYFLIERLGGTTEITDVSTMQEEATYTMTQATRAGLLGVDVSPCSDPVKRGALEKLRSEATIVAEDYGKGGWDKRRMDGMVPLIMASRTLAINPDRYRGTRYQIMAKNVSTLNELTGR